MEMESDIESERVCVRVCVSESERWLLLQCAVCCLVWGKGANATRANRRLWGVNGQSEDAGGLL